MFDHNRSVSIQQRLHKRVLLVSMVLVSGFLLVSYNNVHHETEELFDAQLARSARLILSMAQAEIEEGDFSDIEQFQNFLKGNRLKAAEQSFAGEGNEESSEGHYYETKLAFTVVSEQGGEVLHSHNVPEYLSTIKPAGYSTHKINNYDWRLFRLNNSDGSLFCVTAERIDVRNDLVEKISSNLLLLFALLLVSLGGVIWFAIGSGLTPLRTLAQQIQRRDVDNLEAVDVKDVPTEVNAIVVSLNQLFGRLADALTRERHITSDAAHELRTPLAAVKLHAELAMLTSNNEEKNSSLQYVVEGVNRSSHLVDQVLKLARLEPRVIEQQQSPIDLVVLVKQLVEEHIAQCDAKHIELQTELLVSCFIKGDAVALSLMVRNLLDNAISYTAEHGRVKVTIVKQEQKICLRIEDNGPGIDVAERRRVFERFYRVANHENPGCGIGLAIVARVCELHNATIELLNPATGTGLIVEVCFIEIAA